MKFPLFLLFSLITSNMCGQTNSDKTSKPAERYLYELCHLIKQYSLYKDSIKWDDLEAKVHVLSKQINRIEESRDVIDTILTALRHAGDKHSGFIEKQNAKQLTDNRYAGDWIVSRYLQDGIGYIKVPALFSINQKAGVRFATEIQRQIKFLDTDNSIQGWIVDLRGNKGGSMHPMIKGLSCLIGTGIYGYAIYPSNAVALSTETGQTSYIKLKSPYKTKRPYNRIAVLIDSSTASSGEFTAIAFKSLPNVKFFGQATAGLTTSNQTFRLSDGSFLYLATSFMADRYKNTYLPKIVPDVVVSSQQGSEHDQTLIVAKEWLLSN
ncbi:MAG: hypothetical protein GXC73_13720 [Chitinophagaceae bacterium]|nr:hypothetical protein [Chitinophagaceae bacterium]